MKCIIVDDEPIALEGMAEYVLRIPFLKLIGKYRNAFDAMEVITDQTIDLVFLDINMPELSGIEMINSLKTPPMVIFTTAYSNYAVKGFELNAIDYLLKPITFNKVLKASQKAYTYFKLSNEEDKDLEDSHFIYIKVDRRLVKVNISDIVYVQGLKDYINIFTVEQKYTTYSSLKKIVEVLPQQEFIQVHKSYVVGVKSIDVIDGKSIEMGKQKIPIGRVYKSQLYEKVVKNKFLEK
jgi:DNA-binding LytR/AlgR family response regulator